MTLNLLSSQGGRFLIVFFWQMKLQIVYEDNVFKAFFLKWFFKKPLILLLGISFWKSWLLWDSVVNGFIGLKNIYIYIAETSPSNKFHRQGDLMSPFVFNIAVEMLVILSGRAMENGLYSGIQLLAQIATLLQYADDTLIFCPNDIQVLKNVKTILECEISA